MDENMTKAEILTLLNQKGYKVTEKLGGIEVVAEKRTPMYEFDYTEFVYKVLEGRVGTKKIHFLDPWTFTIECE